MREQLYLEPLKSVPGRSVFLDFHSMTVTMTSVEILINFVIHDLKSTFYQ